jgi:peroxiredoxin Q/BCP
MTDTPLHLNDFAGLSFTNEEGKSVQLTDFIGQRTLIFFFPRADTPGCTAQACGFRDAFPRITEKGATVIGISADTPADLAKWKKKQNLPYTLLSDPDHRITQAMDVWREKSLFGRKFVGIVRSHFIFNESGALETSEISINPRDSVLKGVKGLIG